MILSRLEAAHNFIGGGIHRSVDSNTSHMNNHLMSDTANGTKHNEMHININLLTQTLRSTQSINNLTVLVNLKVAEVCLDRSHNCRHVTPPMGS